MYRAYFEWRNHQIRCHIKAESLHDAVKVVEANFGDSTIVNITIVIPAKHVSVWESPVNLV